MSMPEARNETLPLTLLVLTRNEERNIGRCLDSVPLAAEKIVVDAGSEDGTCEIAAGRGARVVQQEWLGFGPQRNFASAQASHDWILALDADETLSPELVAELRARLPGLVASGAAGAMLPRTAWYMGAPMRWYRPMVGEMMGRLYDRRKARWTDARVHESLRFDGRVERFRHAFHHHHSPTLVHKQLKVLRYSELWALERGERGRSIRPWTCPFVFAGTFFKDYVLRLAFLDGQRGLIVAHVAAAYAVYKRFRGYEMSRNPASRASAADVLERHRLWP
jgi:glycosyltransferase involved in cell wall biosynthesis